MQSKRLLIIYLSLPLLAILSSLSRADIRSATGKPLLDFYTVYGAVDSVRIVNELCNTKYPEYKKQNDLAYESWRGLHKKFIYKIEQYNDALIQEVCKGDKECFNKQMLNNALGYEASKKNMHKMYTEFGEAAYRAACSSYPEYTQSEKADFPNYYKEHIEVFEGFWLSR